MTPKVDPKLSSPALILLCIPSVPALLHLSVGSNTESYPRPFSIKNHHLVITVAVVICQGQQSTGSHPALKRSGARF
ncbi:hypothetical protein M427DRAFT_356136 [Gonapodya prolifera JEL478]|uniref:Secreted protein n=1 Tax=Gonapodya prolifera (strain JEL478) TaxID=1344416 RepID=A0A139ABV0_GONPJ|nr:hypothetical protein M427DRAFT_356136 [Gonapodya prolifera JEL478]|eukprot:KXS13955.1 hypothetical protein M427DRAFT_356136 [Gonapodya prolifera JEL478]